MPDSGCYIYSGDPSNRRWFRQTRVHQTLTLDGKDTAYAPKLLLWRPGENVDVLVVENASYPGLTHRRAVLFVDKQFFVLVDDAIGEATGDVDIHFQFAPGEATYDAQGLTARTAFHDGWNVSVRNVMPEGATLKEEEGQVSFVYTKKEPRPAFFYRVQKTTQEPGIRFVTLVVPYAGKPPEIRVTHISSPAAGGAKVDLELSVNGTSKKIGYDLDGKKHM